jgi:hypothetical protein
VLTDVLSVKVPSVVRPARAAAVDMTPRDPTILAIVLRRPAAVLLVTLVSSSGVSGDVVRSTVAAQPQGHGD